jgi:hypothetical protein
MRWVRESGNEQAWRDRDRPNVFSVGVLPAPFCFRLQYTIERCFYCVIFRT